MPRHTLRGQFTEGTVHRLIIDDGMFTQGHKVVRFVIAADPSGSAQDAYATLSLQYDSPLNWNWGDNRQIGWASTNIVSTAGAEAPFELIDPEHVVIRDLYVQGQVSGAGGTSVINYLVELEPITLTEDEAVLQLIKERSQDDIR